MASGAFFNIDMATGAFTAHMYASFSIISVGNVTVITPNCYPVLWMAVNTGWYVLIMLAVVGGKCTVDILMAGSAHLFCKGALKSGSPDREVRIVVASKADTSIPLRTF